MLRKAVKQAMAGQADDLGGGVYKKRLARNLYRSIILAKGGECWIFEFLFAKQDMANIPDDELKAFRLLAKSYANLTASQVDALIANGHWITIAVAEEETNHE